MTNKEKRGPERVSEQLSDWLQDAKDNEVTKMVEVVEQAKKYAQAAEDLPETRITQFIDNLRHDFNEFYSQFKRDRDHSIYLGLLNESLWSTLAEMTDKSQVEWAELQEDFAHDGIYHAGDYIGFGELVCLNCENKQTITHFSEVVACNQCGHEQFRRQAFAP